MFNVRLSMLALAGLSLALVHSTQAAAFQEDFSTAPAGRGWKVFGDTNLFGWNATNQNLEVTWDSSQTNSYFYRSLGTILSKEDDFALEFDLRLADITTTTKSGPFEIAVGFLNLHDATQPSFWRGSGVNADHGPKNLVELDYFPAGYYEGWGNVTPSMSPTLISTNNGFASGFDMLELTTNDLFHISLIYTASNQTLHTVITRNGAAFGPVDDVKLDSTFSDFRIDTVAISSYSDVGDDFDSVLAHGVMDNLVVSTPPPPVGNVSSGWSNSVWQVQFTSRSNWLYTLERSVDFQSWTDAATSVSGNGTNLTLQDINAPAMKAFYRVRAERP